MDNFDNQFFFDEAKRIINLLKKDFVLSDGALCLKKVGDKKFNNNFADLGDVIPFLLYFGEVEFVDKQIKIFQDKLQKGILISEFPTWKIKDLAKSYEYSDLILGLLDYYDFKKDEESKKILLDNIEKTIDIFRLDKNPSSFYWPKMKMNVPVKDSRDGMMVELFVDLYKNFGEQRYLSIAKNIYTNLLQSNFYKKYKLLPTYSINKYADKLLKLDNAVICKNNTNTLFAFLSLWEATKDEEVLVTIKEMVDAIKDKATFEDGIIKVFVPNQSAKKSFLTSSFAMLDFLTDFYHAYGRQDDLSFAKKIADYWINLQADSGLLPIYNNSDVDFIDSETDISIAFIKLFELTNDQKYMEAADKCLAGIIKMHGDKNYVLSVNINTGETKNNIQKTKFLALFLKLLILKIEMSKGNKIFQDKNLFNLLRDR